MATKPTGLSHDLLVPPGETLREAMDDRGLNQKELALRTAFSEKHISKVLNAKAPISSKFAMVLERTLGIDAVFWINLQANYDIECASLVQIDTVGSDEIHVLSVLKQIIRYFQELVILTRGLEKKKTVLQLRDILCVENLTVIPKLNILAAFRKSDFNKINPYVLLAWVKLCEIIVSKQTIADQLNIERLKSSIPKIKSLMFSNPQTLQMALCTILGECGIKFRIVRNFRGAPVQGYIGKNRNNEMILCMTIRQKYADIFWFSFFHELGHIFAGDISDSFIDLRDCSYKDEKEKRADEFSKNVLIPPSAYRDFLKMDNFSLSQIKKFADSVGVPPYIVIGRLQKEEKVPYSQFSDEKLRYEWA